jgi:hypothetical protein
MSSQRPTTPLSGWDLDPTILPWRGSFPELPKALTSGKSPQPRNLLTFLDLMDAHDDVKTFDVRLWVANDMRNDDGDN